MKKINLVNLLKLTVVALAQKPHDEEEKAASASAQELIPELISENDFAIFREEGLLSDTNEITPMGMKFVLNGTNLTPNFSRLAAGDFSVAVKMLLVGQAELQKKVDATERGEIVPGKTTDLVESLLAVRDWINNVTKTYQESLVVKPKKSK